MCSNFLIVYKKDPDFLSPQTQPWLPKTLTPLHPYVQSSKSNSILSHHDDFSSLFSQCSDAVSISEHLSVQVTDLLRLILYRPIDSEIRNIIEEISTKRKEVKEKELLELVKVMLELSAKLKFAKEELKAGRVVEATEAMRELKVAFGIRDNAMDEEEGIELVVYGLLN